MRRYWLELLSALTVLQASQSSLVKKSDVVYNDLVISSTRTMRYHMNEFAVSLFHQAFDERRNGFASCITAPLALYYPLAFLLSKSRGQTRRELEEAFICHMTNETSDDVTESFLKRVLDEETEYETRMDVSSELRIPAIDDARRIALSSEAESYYTRITAISNNESQNESIMTLSSSMTLNNEWRNPFDASLTREMPFYDSVNSKVKSIPMMRLPSAWLRYKEFPVAGENVHIIDIPYMHGNLSLVVVLPEQSDGLANIMSRDWEDDLKDLQISINNSMTYQCVDLILPKMTFNEVTTYDSLIRTPSLNVTRIFKSTKEFPGINQSRDTRVNKVTNEILVDISEGGSGKWGRSNPHPTAECKSQSEPILFRADHSFLFWIQNFETGLIHVIGIFS